MVRLKCIVSIFWWRRITYWLFYEPCLHIEFFLSFQFNFSVIVIRGNNLRMTNDCLYPVCINFLTSLHVIQLPSARRRTLTSRWEQCSIFAIWEQILSLQAQRKFTTRNSYTRSPILGLSREMPWFWSRISETFQNDLDISHSKSPINITSKILI